MSKLVGGSPSVHASGPCLSTRETEWGGGASNDESSNESPYGGEAI